MMHHGHGTSTILIFVWLGGGGTCRGGFCYAVAAVVVTMLFAVEFRMCFLLLARVCLYLLLVAHVTMFSFVIRLLF